LRFWAPNLDKLKLKLKLSSIFAVPGPKDYAAVLLEFRLRYKRETIPGIFCSDNCRTQKPSQKQTKIGTSEWIELNISNFGHR
jgi:hypothetical protein